MGNVFCNNCGRRLDDIIGSVESKRIPCPDCNSISRRFDEKCETKIGLTTSASMQHKRDDKTIGYSESGRKSGLSADQSDTGDVSYTVTGKSPQGEEDTLQVCRILVETLNKKGASWNSPTAGEGVVDCQAMDKHLNDKILLVQVVHANIDSNFWKSLNREGKIIKTGKPEELADQLTQAIDSKANNRKIPLASRKGLILALDATKLPAHGFDAVIEAFHTKWGAWSRTLGFDGIWLVGPSSTLTWRLDLKSKAG